MDNSMIRLLERAAERFPDKTALADENTSYTYREYLGSARIVGGYIAEVMAPGTVRQPIAVLIERNAKSIVAFMGIVCSGNFYVPLDAGLPEERLGVILSELSPAGIIDCRGVSGEKAKEAAGISGRSAVTFEEILSYYGKDAGRADTLVEERIAETIDTDPLYAIFTSGSTGVPKGVLVSHRSVMDLTDAFAEVFSFDEGSVFGNQAPFDFDVSVKDIYNAMKCGGRVEVIPKRMFVRPNLLLPYLAEREINTLIWAVSAVRIVAEFRALDEVRLEKPLRLRYIMFSGEVMPVKSLNYFMERMPETVFVNLYGPTEITCNCTYYIVDRQYAPDEMLPIGRAFPNTRILLLDEQQRRINEPGKTGEICVAGSCLALGYWNAPARTAESFCQNPEIKGYSGLIYRTGDLAYFREDGSLVFASRKDFQIKHMGHRIELGEIEAALNGIEWIDVSCCLYDTVKEKIFCFYQAEVEDRKGIVKILSTKLPKYMWPNKYIRVDAMPLNAHGKIDRRALEELKEKG